MKSGSVKRSSFFGNAFRWDASYHLSEGVEARHAVGSYPFGVYMTQEVAEDIFIGPRAKRYYVKDQKHGIPFLSSSDILLSDFSNLKLGSIKYMPVEEMMLQKGWTLISRSGTIGNCAFANAKHAQKLASEHVIRLKPNNILRSGVIYAFFASKYGYKLLTQGTFGAVIQHIEPPFVGSLPIPRFSGEFQREVDDLIQESARLREDAADAFEEAISYFNDLYPCSSDITKIFTRKIKNLPLGLAAYNNNIEVDQFINQFKANSVSLTKLTKTVFAPPLFKHIYLSRDNGFPFITGSELTRFNIRYYRWLSPKGVKNINDYVVKKGTLLLYKSGTTDGGILGNVFIADGQLDGCCLSDHVIRIVFHKSKDAYWTFAFLRSKGGIKYLQRLATGTMIPFITPERVSEILIPCPDAKYNWICDKVEQFLEYTTKAKIYENKAISMVEAEIEKWSK